MWEKFAPTHRSRDMGRMRSGCERIVNGNLWEIRTHNSRTDSRRIFKLGGGIDHVTRRV